MFPEDALPLHAYAEVLLAEKFEDEEGKQQEEISIIHNGTVSCRELRKGEVYYHIKPTRGKAEWFSHKRLMSKENIEEPKVEVETE